MGNRERRVEFAAPQEWSKMSAIIEPFEAALGDVCRRHHVAKLELFGSAVGEQFDPARSDLDFLVEFGKVPDGRRFDHFFDLQRELSELFGRPVDLVEPGAMTNPYFIRSVNATRKVVYAA